MFISKDRTEEMLSFLTKDKKIRFNHLTMEPHSPFQSEMLHKLRNLKWSNCSRCQFYVSTDCKYIVR